MNYLCIIVGFSVSFVNSFVNVCRDKEFAIIDAGFANIAHNYANIDAIF